MQLEKLQRSMMAAIELGPDHVVDSGFLGGRAAALRGLSVHANTISHARLVAIEETFPRTRERLGEVEFNAVSRDYLELPEIADVGHPLIGRRFPAFLANQGHGGAGALATFEWAWLEAYHAADDDAFELAALAGLGEKALLATWVALHPAARMVAAVGDEALERDVPGLADAEAILVTRPGTEVLISPASAAMTRQFEILREPQTICNLLECSGELAGEDGLQALFGMLEAGALVLA